MTAIQDVKMTAIQRDVKMTAIKRCQNDIPVYMETIPFLRDDQ